MRQKAENRIWFHGCSLGEVNSLRPIAERLENIHITTTTDTGYKAAKAICKSAQFLPFEPLLWVWMRKQKKLVVLEAEFWFLLFYIAKKRGAETILLNGRLNEYSFHNYLRFRWFYREMFKYIDLFLVQSEADKARFQKLGAKNIVVLGNIKLVPSKSSGTLQISTDRKILTIASTHQGEEEYILQALKNLQILNNYFVIVVPRHKERFDEVWDCVRRFATSSRYSDSGIDTKSNILLFDTIGKLVDIYAISDIVVLGGSFFDGIGGHNLVEPASFNPILITGPYIFNQKEIAKYIENLYITSDLEDILKNLDGLKRSRIAQRIDIESVINYLV